MAQASQESDDGIITGINVTPLVDIILVLLIIFMLTANLIAKPSINVELPEASTGEAAEPTTVALTLTRSGELFLNGIPVTDTELPARLREAAKNDPKTQAIIAADKEVSHGAVIRLIDTVRQNGIYKFALNIDPAVTAAKP